MEPLPPGPSPQGCSRPGGKADAASMPLLRLCCRSHWPGSLRPGTHRSTFTRGWVLALFLARTPASSLLLERIFKSCQDLPCPGLSLLDSISSRGLAACSHPQQNQLIPWPGWRKKKKKSLLPQLTPHPHDANIWEIEE